MLDIEEEKSKLQIADRLTNWKICLVQEYRCHFWTSYVIKNIWGLYNVLNLGNRFFFMTGFNISYSLGFGGTLNAAEEDEDWLIELIHWLNIYSNVCWAAPVLPGTLIIHNMNTQFSSISLHWTKHFPKKGNIAIWSKFTIKQCFYYMDNIRASVSIFMYVPTIPSYQRIPIAWFIVKSLYLSAVHCKG